MNMKPLRQPLALRSAVIQPAAPLLLALAAGCAATPRQESVEVASGPISTDRPGFLYTTSLVPEGRLQVEAGLPQVALDEADGSDSTLASLPVQLRYGASSSLELRLGSSAYNWLDTDAGPDEDGFGDLEFGAKVPVALPFGQDSSVVIASLRVPTGQDPFAIDGVGPSVQSVASWAVEEELTLTGLAGLAYLPLEGSDDPLIASLAALATRSLGNGWSGSLEADWFPAANAVDTAYLGAWVTKLIAHDAQLDASVHRGLTDDSLDWILSLGFSVRF